jgi:hypothetical protein
VTATLPPATAPAQAITPRAWRVLAVTSLGVFVVLLDTTIINIAGYMFAVPWLTCTGSSTRSWASRRCQASPFG